MSRMIRALLGWAVVVATVLALATAGLMPAGAQVEPLPADQRDRAALIYANQCATCHGAAGEGGVIAGTGGDPVPPLTAASGVTVPYVDLVLRTGRMPPAESPYDNRPRRVALDSEERRLLVAYLAEELDLPGTVPTPGEGDPARGREVFAANCAACHGNAGAGGVAGAGAWTPQVNELDAIAIAEATRVGPFQMPAFNSEQISDAEVADMAAFLAEVRAEEGTPAGLTELNPVYASGLAFLFTMVVVGSLLWIAGRPTWFPDPEGQHSRTSASPDGGQEAKQ